MTAVALAPGLERYHAAIAELAPRAHPSFPTEGAVWVLSGTRDWCRRAERAGRDGAVAIVVDEPVPATDRDHARVAGLAIPVILSRRRVRADLVVDAATQEAAHLVTVDGFGPRSSWPTWARDAVGWARVLGGGCLEPTARHVSSDVLLVALASASGVPATVTCTLGGPGSAVAIDAVALAPRRVEVRIDETAGLAEAATVSDAGRLVAPTRFESTERLALRRALDALGDTTPPADLTELRHDEALVRAMAEPAG